MSTDQKALWQRYYKERRDALISKVEGMSEYQARMPRTPTGTSLIGIIKHVLGKFRTAWKLELSKQSG